MKRLRDPLWFLILMFLGTLASVPLIQMVIEIRQQEIPGAFDVFNQPPTADKAAWALRLTEDLE